MQFHIPCNPKSEAEWITTLYDENQTACDVGWWSTVNFVSNVQLVQSQNLKIISATDEGKSILIHLVFKLPDVNNINDHTIVPNPSQEVT